MLSLWCTKVISEIPANSHGKQRLMNKRERLPTAWLKKACPPSSHGVGEKVVKEE
jgi:hypothetical protein